MRWSNVPVEEFILLSQKVHGNNFNYDLLTKEQIKIAKSKIILKCNLCNHINTPIIDNHIRGSKCIKCTNHITYTLEIFLRKAKEIHGDKYDYSEINESDIKNSLSLVCIKCKLCNYKWKTTINNHIRGKGCMDCKRGIWTEEKFLRKAKEIHGESFNYVIDKNHKIGCYTKINMTCNSCNYKWNSTTLTSHIRGAGCPKCKKTLPYTLESFLKKANEIHGNEYDYSLIKPSDIKNCKSYLLLKCNKCNYTWNTTTVIKHIQGGGCPKCNRGLKYSLEIFLEKASEIHGNKYNYSLINEEDIKNSKSYITIICTVCNFKWDTSVNNHISRHGYVKCVNSLPYTLDIFLEKATKIHGNKFDYSLINKENIKNSKSYIEIICIVCKFKWKTRINNHITGHGCPKCANTLLWILQRFLLKSIEIHGDKYNYEKINEENIKGINSKLLLKCNQCNYDFFQLLNSHIKGSGCPKCNKVLPWTLEKFKEKSLILHGNKYDYSNINSENISGAYSKITLKCNKCNYQFQQTVSSHINGGHGCSNCAKQIKYNKENFIRKSIEIYGDNYDYINVDENDIINSYSRVKLKCNICNLQFIVRIANHIYKSSGCPHCNKSRGYSNAQISWLESIMEIEGIEIQHALSLEGEYKISSVGKVDGYCKETNTVYEYHGDFWHGNPNIFNPNKLHPYSRKNETFGDKYLKTNLRDQKIRDLGYNLIIRWETDLEE